MGGKAEKSTVLMRRGVGFAVIAVGIVIIKAGCWHAVDE